MNFQWSTVKLLLVLVFDRLNVRSGIFLASSRIEEYVFLLHPKDKKMNIPCNPLNRMKRYIRGWLCVMEATNPNVQDSPIIRANFTYTTNWMTCFFSFFWVSTLKFFPVTANLAALVCSTMEQTVRMNNPMLMNKSRATGSTKKMAKPCRLDIQQMWSP